jgi:hypothetical protein
MKFKEIANRISGLSVPVFGVQWTPKELEIEKARRIIAFLEDRRVLYSPDEVEVPEHCVRSILKIREFITTELGDLDADTELAKHLRAMRAASRKCLNDVSEDDGRIIQYSRHSGHYASWQFYGDVGIMRGVFGVHIAQIAVAYGLDVEDELA